MTGESPRPRSWPRAAVRLPEAVDPRTVEDMVELLLAVVDALVDTAPGRRLVGSVEAGARDPRPLPPRRPARQDTDGSL